MALIQCGECGHQVSTHAPACPGCGVINRKEVPLRSKKNLAEELAEIGGIASLLIGGLILAFATLMAFGTGAFRPDNAHGAAANSLRAITPAVYATALILTGGVLVALAKLSLIARSFAVPWEPQPAQGKAGTKS